MNSLSFMPYIPRFKYLAYPLILAICFSNCFLSASYEELLDLEKRLSIYPPSKEDYLPILEVIDSQITALRFHNIEKAYFAYTSKEFRKETSLQIFTLFVKANTVLSNNKSISLTEIRMDKNISYYKGVITSKDGKTRTINYQLILEDDYWKILGMQLQPGK